MCCSWCGTVFTHKNFAIVMGSRIKIKFSDCAKKSILMPIPPLLAGIEYFKFPIVML